MAEQVISTRIIQKHDTALNWSKAVNFVPKKGEVIIYDADTEMSCLEDGYYTITNEETGRAEILTDVEINGTACEVLPSRDVRMKIGDGETNVNLLPFVNSKASKDNDIINSYNSTNILEFYDPSRLLANVIKPSAGLRAIVTSPDGSDLVTSNSYLTSYTAKDSHDYLGQVVSFTPTLSGIHKFGVATWADDIRARIASVQIHETSGLKVPFPLHEQLCSFSDGSLVNGAYSLTYGWQSGCWAHPVFGNVGTGGSMTLTTTDSSDGDNAAAKITILHSEGQVSGGCVYKVLPNTNYTFSFKFKRTAVAAKDVFLDIKGGTENSTATALCSRISLGTAITSGWQKKEVTFNTGNNSTLLVMFGSAASKVLNWTTYECATSELLIDEAHLKTSGGMDDLIQDYSDKVAEAYSGEYALKYPEQHEMLHISGDKYPYVFEMEDVEAQYQYLFNVNTGYLTAGKTYCANIYWKILAQPITVEPYTTLSAADKVALVTKQCQTAECIQTGGYWIGDPTGVRRAFTLEIEYDPNMPSLPRVLALNISHDGCAEADITVDILNKRLTLVEQSCCTIKDYDYGPTLIELAPHDPYSLKDWGRIAITVANRDPNESAVIIDKIALYGDILDSYRASSFAVIEGNKRVTFDNVVRANEFDGVIDDGCLDVY